MTNFSEIPVLATPLYEFNVPKKLQEKILKQVEEINWESMSNRDNLQHYGKSITGDNSWHNKEQYKYIVDYIEDCLLQIKETREMNLIEKISVCLLWVNKSEHGQWHHAHTHPWSLLSGILYLKGTTGRTWFSRSSEYKDTMCFNIYNPHEKKHDDLIYKHTPKPGTLIIFPSNLCHSVDNTAPDEERITLSFNSFPTGTVGDIMNLAGLQLKII